MRHAEILFILVFSLGLMACSKPPLTPYEKGLENVRDFLYKNIDDYKSIEIVDTLTENLGYSFEEALMIKTLEDSVSYFRRMCDDLQKQLEIRKSIGIPYDSKPKELYDEAISMKHAADRLTNFLKTCPDTDQFVIYYSFRHNVKGNPKLEKLMFYCDEKGKLLGVKDCSTKDEPISRLTVE